MAVTDEQIIAGIKAINEWLVPYTAPRESGVALDGDITQADADQINKEWIEHYRPFLQAALSLPGAAIDKKALSAAVKKTAKLRVEDVGGRKERPAETVKSCLNRGFSGLGSDEGISYILRHAIKYYLAALEDGK